MLMLSNMTRVDIRDLYLEEWMHLLGLYPLTDGVGVGIACVTFRLSFTERQVCGAPLVG